MWHFLKDEKKKSIQYCVDKLLRTPRRVINSHANQCYLLFQCKYENIVLELQFTKNETSHMIANVADWASPESVNIFICLPKIYSFIPS